MVWLMCVVIKNKAIEGVCVWDGGRGRDRESGVCVVFFFSKIFFLPSYIRVLYMWLNNLFAPILCRWWYIYIHRHRHEHKVAHLASCNLNDRMIILDPRLRLFVNPPWACVGVSSRQDRGMMLTRLAPWTPWLSLNIQCWHLSP